MQDLTIKRAALYIRVSTEEQARHGLSLNDQRDDLQKYAESHGFQIAGVYEDAGISARKSYKRRPALLQLLEDCKAGKIDTILFIKLDRWFRNVGNYYAVQEILDQCGVSWQATKEDYETSTASGRLKVNIMLSVAQDEADRTSERIKFVFEGKKQRMEPITGNCPFGYKIEGKSVVKDKAAAAAVDAFFKKYMACGSITVTQKYILDEYGIRIMYQLADKMLKSPAYYGTFYGVPGMCPPYITMEEHTKIESMRQRVVRKTMNNRVYLFSGLLVCGECGHRMNAKVNTKYRKKALEDQKSSYTCPGHYCNRTGCTNNASMRENKIEQYLIDTIDYSMQHEKVRVLDEWKKKNKKDVKPEISALKARIARSKEMCLNQLLSIEEYKKELETCEARIAELEQDSKDSEPPNFDNLEKLLSENWKELYKDMDKEGKREFWRIIIKEIRLYPDHHIEYDINI